MNEKKTTVLRNWLNFVAALKIYEFFCSLWIDCDSLVAHVKKEKMHMQRLMKREERGKKRILKTFSKGDFKETFSKKAWKVLRCFMAGFSEKQSKFRPHAHKFVWDLRRGGTKEPVWKIVGNLREETKKVWSSYGVLKHFSYAFAMLRRFISARFCHLLNLFECFLNENLPLDWQ